jgi:hypothetical protein
MYHIKLFMKQVKFLAALLLFALGASAQTVTPDPGPYTPMNQKYEYRWIKTSGGLWNLGKFVQVDSAQFNGVTYVPSAASNDSTIKAANTGWVRRLFATASGSAGKWDTAGNAGLTDPRLGTTNNSPFAIVTNNIKRLIIPAAGILPATTNAVFLVKDTLNGELKYTTSGGGDTTGLGNLYIRNTTTQENKRFNVKGGRLDTLYSSTSGGGRIVSNGGTIAAEWGAGGGSNFDFHGFAGYNANRASSYTARSFTDKNYVDSSVAAGGSGWSLTGNASAVTDFLGTTNNRTMRFRTNNTERMTIDSVGTVDVKKKLTVGTLGNSITNDYIARFLNNTGGSDVEINGNGYGRMFFNDYSAGTNLKYYEFLNFGSDFKISRLNDANTLRTERLTIFGSNGNVFLGTNPVNNGYRLEVNGNTRINPVNGGNIILGDLFSTPASGFPAISLNGILDGTNYNFSSSNATKSLFINVPGTNTINFRQNNADKVVLASTGNLIVGSATDVPSAILNATSTTQGVLFPRMTTTQKNAIATPAAGLVVYDTTLNKLCVYTTAWETITSL